MYLKDHFLIGGKHSVPNGNEVSGVICPSTEETIGTVPTATSADIDQAVDAARRAFDEGPWPRMSLADRVEILMSAYRILQPSIDEISRLTTAEMGVPITVATNGYTPRALALIPSLTKLVDQIVFEEERLGASSPALIWREPIGVAAAIAPWNGPFMNAIGKLTPALLMGCTVVYKPAPETPLDAYYFVDALYEAGIPSGAVNLVPGGREVGEHLVRHKGVDKVSFTGSTVAGRRVGAICGEQFKRVTLELGGKSAAIVLEDADLEVTGKALAMAAFGNSGQVCASFSRVLAPRALYDDVVELLADRASQQLVGDPFDPKTTMGPLVAERQRDRVEGFIASGLREDARLVTGGGRPVGLDKGWFVEPTVFADVTTDMTIGREEIFGPVVGVIPYDSVDEAISIANQSEYGLHGGVFSSDVEQATAVARRIRTGTVSVNGYLVNFDAPFGGVKCSGIGREFSVEGLLSFSEQKTVNYPLGLPDRSGAV